MRKATIIELSKESGIYVVVDERGRPFGTGARETCEMLAKIAMKQNALRAPRQTHQELVSEHDNIRSAIKI